MNRKVVLITGASRGIGASIARKMASQDYNIVVNYLTSESKVLQLKQEIEEKYKVNVFPICADVSKEDEVKSMVGSIIEKFGHIDCLVNNAAINPGNRFEEKSKAEFEEVLQTDLVGPFLTCKYVGLHMLERKEGCIVNISSTNGIDTPDIYSMDYNAAKAGLISLTQSYAISLAPYVRVNAIAPGWTSTASVLEMNPTYLEEEKNKILLERFATPEEIANVVCFLASREASYINGSVIRVDGGLKK